MILAGISSLTGRKACFFEIGGKTWRSTINGSRQHNGKYNRDPYRPHSAPLSQKVARTT